MIITKDLIRNCLHCLANSAQTTYKDNRVTREHLMESHEALMTFLYSNHPSRKYYELTPYKEVK